MNPRADYYHVLSVETDADDEAIKRAYRRLAMQYHPDRNPNNPESEAKFKEVQEAYDILSDAAKKKRYDSIRNGQPGRDGFDNSGWDDFFQSNFRQSSQPRTGANVYHDLWLSLEEVAKGCEADLEIPWNESCPDCSGRGLKSGRSKTSCSHCNGKGRVTTQRRISNGGVVTTVVHCTHCGGTGTTSDPKDRCATCSGNGIKDSRKTVSVTVPQGLADGISLRVVNQGLLRDPSGPRGHLFVTVRIKKHEIFEFDAADIYLRYPITFFEAAFGVKVMIPTLYGPYEIELKPGTQSGKRVVIENKGLSMRGTAKGAMIVEFYCEIPALTDISDRNLITRATLETETSLPETFRVKKKFADYMSKVTRR